jgi:hypothetical protein
MGLDVGLRIRPYEIVTLRLVPAPYARGGAQSYLPHLGST